MAVLGGFAATADGQQGKPVSSPLKSGDARPVARGAQLFKLVERPGPLPAGALRTNDEREKGGAAGDVFARVAPAIVFILAENGSGTGFIVDVDGRIVTNHHVVSEPGLDDETGARRVQIHLGLLDRKDLTINVIKDGVTALIYKEDPVKDLALLKLTATPPQVKSLTKIDLAPGAPRLTDECISIGHPSGGALWTVRVGHVTATARWPGDRLHEAVEILRSDKDKRAEIEQLFRSAPGRRVVLSDCITGAGDSGGPLLDSVGRLIGVTFGGPASPRAAQLSYHIHLDEVRSFLAEAPSKPLVYEPDPWSEAIFAKPPFDLDRDGKPETLVVFSDPAEPPAAILVDLSQRSRLDNVELATDLDQMKRDWHPTFALTLLGGRPYKAFYDSDGDQAIDLVLALPLIDPGANKADDRLIAAIRRKGERWFKAVPRAGDLIDPSLVPDGEKRGRIEEVVRVLKRAKLLGDQTGSDR
jgi:S1-C subfamily serine protease